MQDDGIEPDWNVPPSAMANVLRVKVDPRDVIETEIPEWRIVDDGDLHRNAPVPPIAGVSPALDEVFQRALAKRPGDRLASALDFAAAMRTAQRASMREQVRASAPQWQERDRPRGLLWRDDALADLERWTQRAPTAVLGDVEASFIDASRRHARRASWIRRALVALIAAALLAGIQYRAMLQARMAEELAERSVTLAAVEQGRQALLHGESAEAQLHLAAAYRPGNHSPAVEFVLSRALQPRIAQRARLASTTGRMWSAMFSRDGRRIVTGDDHGARTWDAESGALLVDLPHGDTVMQAAWSPNDDRIFTAGADGIVKIWDSASGAILHDLRSGAGAVHYYALALSPSGHAIAAIDNLGKVAHVWDTATGAMLAELVNDGSEFPSIAFSSDGRWLATSGGGDVRVFNTATWACAGKLTSPNGGRIRALSFDPVGSRLATGTSAGDASLWAVPSGEGVLHLRDVGESIDAIAFAPNGALIVTGARDGAEQVWDATSGRLVSQFNHHRSRIQFVEFDPASRLVLAAGANGTVVVSDAAQGIVTAVLEGPSGVVRVAHFDRSSRSIVGASWDGTARVMGRGLSVPSLGVAADWRRLRQRGQP